MFPTCRSPWCGCSAVILLALLQGFHVRIATRLYMANTGAVYFHQYPFLLLRAN
jgi:hypothetical protein